MSLVTNVVRRGGLYYFRVRVPLRHRLQIGRTELWKSLRTSVPSEARNRASFLSALTSELWLALEPHMTMKDGHDLVKSWLKAEIDGYRSLQADIKSELDRVRPGATRPDQLEQSLDLDAIKPDAKEKRPKETGVGLTVAQAAKLAIPELARTEGFRPKRRNDYQNAVDSFVAWNGADPDLAELTPELIGAFKSDLTYYPARGSVRPAYRDLDWKARVEKARSTEEPDVLNAATINTKYLSPLRSIFRYHQGLGLQLKVNPFDGISARRKRGAKREGNRRDFTARELRTMFSQPMFSGSKGASQAALYQSGDVRISDWRYWVPLISFFTGARLNELCAVGVNDFREEKGLHYVLIRDLEEGQNSKSDAAWRRVPLHDQLIRLRLPDYVNLRRAEGATRLFDNLPVDAFGYVSGAPSKFFARLTKSVAEPDPEERGNLVFHSARHTVIGRLRSADVRMDVAYQIVGHEEGTVHSGYGGVSLQALKIAVDKIEYEGLDLRHVELPTAVLPKSKS